MGALCERCATGARCRAALEMPMSSFWGSTPRTWPGSEPLARRAPLWHGVLGDLQGSFLCLQQLSCAVRIRLDVVGSYCRRGGTARQSSASVSTIVLGMRSARFARDRYDVAVDFGVSSADARRSARRVIGLEHGNLGDVWAYGHAICRPPSALAFATRRRFIVFCRVESDLVDESRFDWPC